VSDVAVQPSSVAPPSTRRRWPTSTTTPPRRPPARRPSTGATRRTPAALPSRYGSSLVPHPDGRTPAQHPVARHRRVWS